MLLQELRQYPRNRMVGSLHKSMQRVLLYLYINLRSSTPPTFSRLCEEFKSFLEVRYASLHQGILSLRQRKFYIERGVLWHIILP